MNDRRYDHYVNIFLLSRFGNGIIYKFADGRNMTAEDLKDPAVVKYDTFVQHTAHEMNLFWLHKNVQFKSIK